MSDPVQPPKVSPSAKAAADAKVDPETLVLKASPRRVVRFKRNLLIGIAAIGCVAIFGITWMALKAPHFQLDQNNSQTAGTANKPAPDAVAKLPANYSQMPKPKLGPPLPGDLGLGIVQRENQLGVSPDGSNTDDAVAQAEHMRLAQQTQHAHESGVFFQVTRHSSAATAPKAVATPASVAAQATEARAANANRLNLDLERDQNDQQRKTDFIHQSAARSIYNDHAVQTPASPYEVLAGTVIAASLLTGLNSDLPGLVTAQITENVYDSVSGRVLLIPQGSRLIGSYDSVVAFGQSRALVVWQRIIMPDGSSIQIDNLPATDPAGYAGLEDEVDYHTWILLKGIAMSTLLGVGTQVTFGGSQSNLVEAIRESTQESTNRAGQRIVEKDLNIQPTITVRPGWPLRVIVHKDLILRPYQG
ncbi:MAG: TrbI/VirB10 family protein [Alphaproteobacteria bacterium]|nr:TrbI/VirB10 family protein [Alphaproteobacteria bacterium]MDE2110230.1 TrbI/VirB10 family protein [Alphaproteobacteria bacterium]